MSETQTLGQLLRRLREERGWSLRDVAKKVNLSYTTVASKERGAVKIRPHEKQIFASAYNLLPHELDKMLTNQEHRGGKRGQLPLLNLIAGRIVSLTGISLTKPHQAETGSYVERGDVEDEYAFAIVAPDDSMDPAVKLGDILVMSPTKVEGRSEYPVHNDDVVLVRVRPGHAHAGTHVGRYFATKDGFEIRFDNQQRPPIRLKHADVENLCIGLELRRRKF